MVTGLLRVMNNIVSATASVMNSAAGVASQSPVICHKNAKRYANGIISTTPRNIVMICAYKPLLDAAKYAENSRLKPEKSDETK